MVLLSAFRVASVMLAIGWCITLSQGNDVIAAFPSNDGLEMLGNAKYWFCWDGAIAAIGVIGLMPLYTYWRVACSLVEMAWWLNVAYRFSLVSPFPTGVAAYVFAASINLLTAYGTLRTGKA